MGPYRAEGLDLCLSLPFMRTAPLYDMYNYKY